MLAALRVGDERAFRRPVAELTPMLLTLARRYVDTPAAAEDVVQDTWLAVLAGLDRFEQRSSLRTWVCGILVHKARRLGVRDRRSLPLYVDQVRRMLELTRATPAGPVPAAMLDRLTAEFRRRSV